MNNEDKIRELFAEKLGNLEAPVNPELWSAISSQIGTAATVTSTGLSVVAKTIIGISAATVIGVSTYFIASNTGDEEQQPQTQQTTQLITEEKITINESLAEKEVVETVKERETDNGTRNNIVKEKVSQSTPINHIVPIDKPLDILLDTRTFIADLTPDLTKQTKTEAIVPVKNEIKTEDKYEQTASNNADLGQEVLKPSFEITHLPNIYGLYAGGYFSIAYKGEYSDFQITILDSRNNVVFSSDRPDFEWRGSDMSGNQVEPGKYVYIITAKDLNGNAINKYSPLTVINQ